MQQIFFNHNGKLIKAGTPVISADSRAFRYGDGLFETIKVQRYRIRLQDLHFARLFTGLEKFQFQLPGFFGPAYLAEEIIRLCRKNNHSSARVRLTVFRGNGGMYDPENHFPNFLIQTWAIADEPAKINENGLVTGIYTEAVKAIDSFSNLKTNNFQPYFLGALYAKKMRWNDAILLNSSGNICDSTVANIFLVRGRDIFTPALSEGCVAGVMRNTLLSLLPEAGYHVTEHAVIAAAIDDAEEIWFTNAMHPLRWIGECKGRNYSGVHAREVFIQLSEKLKA